MAAALAQKPSGLLALHQARMSIEQKERADLHISDLSDQRQLQLDVARASLASLRLRMFQVFGETSTVHAETTEWSMGHGRLVLGPLIAGPEAAVAGIQVFGWAPLEVSSVSTDNGTVSCSASLIFGQRATSQEPRWLEIAFRRPLVRSSRESQFGLDPSSREFQFALDGTSIATRVAYGPLHFSSNGAAEFLDRWAHLYALAIQGQLALSEQRTAVRPAPLLPLRLMAMVG